MQQQQDEYSIEMRNAAASAAWLANEIAAIFAGAADFTDAHSYDAADRRMVRQAEREDLAEAFKGEF